MRLPEGSNRGGERKMMLDWHGLAKEHQEDLLREAEGRRLAKELAARSRRAKRSSLWDALPSWLGRWLLKGGTGAVREGCREPWAPYEQRG